MFFYQHILPIFTEQPLEQQSPACGAVFGFTGEVDDDLTPINFRQQSQSLQNPEAIHLGL